MINQFKDDYKKLITDFSVIDENDPITIDKLNQVTSNLDSSCLEFEKMKSDIKKKRSNFDKKNNHTTKKFKKKIENIESIYVEKIDTNKENHTISCNKLKEKLEQYKIDFVIPTHDTIALFLAENKDKFTAAILVAPYETAKICREKQYKF